MFEDFKQRATITGRRVSIPHESVLIMICSSDRCNKLGILLGTFPSPRRTWLSGQNFPVSALKEISLDSLTESTDRPTLLLCVCQSSVSAECNLGEALATAVEGERRVIPKTPEERTEILEALGENILFKSLDDDLKATVVDAVFPVSSPAGAAIISQGDEGDNCYIIREGEAMVFMQMPDGESKHLVTYGMLEL